MLRHFELDLTYIVADFGLDDVDENVEEWHSFNHHRSVSSREDASSEGKNKLGNDTPARELPGRGIVEAWPTHDMKNMDTPREPKSLNIGLAGNLSVSVILDSTHLLTRSYHRRPRPRHLTAIPG
jgi:hypothetical protein